GEIGVEEDLDFFAQPALPAGGGRAGRGGRDDHRGVDAPGGVEVGALGVPLDLHRAAGHFLVGYRRTRRVYQGEAHARFEEVEPLVDDLGAGRGQGVVEGEAGAGRGDTGGQRHGGAVG